MRVGARAARRFESSYTVDLELRVRATTLLNRVLDLDGVNVVGVDADGLRGGGPVLAQIAARRRLLSCPHCGFSTRHRYDRREVGLPLAPP